MTLQDRSSDRLQDPMPGVDPDVLTLTFQVKLCRDGLAGYYAEYPDFRGETPAQTLIRETIAQWESEALVSDAEGRRSA